MLLQPMNEIKTPPAHNKFTICSISLRPRVPGHSSPHGKWTFRQGDRKPSCAPRASRTPLEQTSLLTRTFQGRGFGCSHLAG